MQPQELILNLEHSVNSAVRQVPFQGLLSNSKELSFSIQPQLQSNWCWAAVATSVSLFYWKSSNWTQCGVVSTTLGRNDCCNSPTPSACDVYGYLDKALTTTSNYKQMVSGAISFSAIQSEINAGRTIGARIGWNGGGGHFVVIYGYWSLGAATSLYIGDPIYGDSVVSLATFTSNYQGAGTWTHSYFTQPFIPTVHLKFSPISDALLSKIQGSQTERFALLSTTGSGSGSATNPNVTAAHQIFRLGLDDLAQNRTPSLSGLRALESSGTLPAAAAYDLDEERGELLQYITSSPQVKRFSEALEIAMKLPAPSDGTQWEVRELIVHGLNAAFLWLHYGTGDQDQLISLNSYAGQSELKPVLFRDAVEKMKQVTGRVNTTDPESGS